jgi:hypothetical protein
MREAQPQDAAEFARRHAGEWDNSLTPAQRDLLGRVIGKRIERGAKLEMIARAAAHALPELEAERARRLGRDEALRALAWETLHTLRARGETRVAVSAAADACPVCRAAHGAYAIEEAPAIPVVGCTHTGGCRCLYRAVPGEGAMPGAATSAAEDGEPPQPARPWYRPRPPRPHGPRWSEEERAAEREKRQPQGKGSSRRPSR